MKWALAAQQCNGKRKRKGPVTRTSETGLFQKCPSVDVHSGMTLQQTYYLLFCHFGFSTTNLGPDSISTPETSACLTISAALPLPRWVGVSPRGGDGAFYSTSLNFKKHLAPDPELIFSAIKGVAAATAQNLACKQKCEVCGVCNCQ